MPFWHLVESLLVGADNIRLLRLRRCAARAGGWYPPLQQNQL